MYKFLVELGTIKVVMHLKKNGKQEKKITKEEYIIKDVFSKNAVINVNEVIKKSFLINLRDCKLN